MTQPEQGRGRPGRPRPTPRRIVVRSVRELSPRTRGVTFGGAELAGFAWSGPAAHVKLVFPLPGETAPPPVTPDGPRPPTIRTYTPRRFDPAAGELDVDFVLHGEGPGSTWAAKAQPGQELVLMGPGRGYAVDPDAAWYVLAGDDAAVPAIETLLEAIPAAIPTTVLLEVPAASEQRLLAGSGRAEVRWLTRGEDPSRAGTELWAALNDFAWPDGAGRFYLGCEARAMRRIRAGVIDAGLDKARIVTRGYWQLGEVDHPDHDYGDDGPPSR